MFVYSRPPTKKKKSINAKLTRNWRSPTSAKQKGIINYITAYMCEEKKQINQIKEE